MPYTLTVYLTDCLSIVCLSACPLVSPRLASHASHPPPPPGRGKHAYAYAYAYAYVPGGANCCASIPRLDQPVQTSPAQPTTDKHWNC